MKVGDVNMKERYSDQEGNIVELTDEEFAAYPYNVKLLLLSKEKQEPSKEENDDKERAALILKLNCEAGISVKRATKMVEEYGDEATLKKNLNKLALVESEALKLYYSKPVKKKIKGDD